MHTLLIYLYSIVYRYRQVLSNECNDTSHLTKSGAIRLYFKRIWFFGDISFSSRSMYVEILTHAHVIFLIRDLKCFLFSW